MSLHTAIIGLSGGPCANLPGAGRSGHYRGTTRALQIGLGLVRMDKMDFFLLSCLFLGGPILYDLRRSGLNLMKRLRMSHG